MKCPYCNANLPEGSTSCAFCNSTFTTGELNRIANGSKGTYEVTRGAAELERLLQTGETHLRMKNYYDARIQFEMAAKEYPGDYRVWLGMARLETEDYSLTFGDNARGSTVRRYLDNAVTVAPESEKPRVQNIRNSYLSLCEKQMEQVNQIRQQEEERARAEAERERSVSFADRLRSQTPTAQQLEQRRISEREQQVLSMADTAVRVFERVCSNYASKGYRSCWMYLGDNEYAGDNWTHSAYWVTTGKSESVNKKTNLYSSGGFVNDFYRRNALAPSEQELFLGGVREQLNNKGFSGLEITTEDIYVHIERNRIVSYSTKKKSLMDPHVATVFKVAACW